MANMKKIKITVEVECKHSTKAAKLASAIEDGLLCDNVKKGTVEYEENGKLETSEFENYDFEE